MDDLFVGRILWMYPVWRVERAEKGGCLTALDGSSFIFNPTNRRDYVYAHGYQPAAGDVVRFSIEWGGHLGHAGYRVTHIEPLDESLVHAEDMETLNRLWDEFQHREAMKKLMGPQARK